MSVKSKRSSIDIIVERDLVIAVPVPVIVDLFLRRRNSLELVYGIYAVYSLIGRFLLNEIKNLYAGDRINGSYRSFRKFRDNVRFFTLRTERFVRKRCRVSGVALIFLRGRRDLTRGVNGLSLDRMADRALAGRGCRAVIFSPGVRDFAPGVAECVNRSIGVTVVATRAGMRRVSRFGAGRCSYDCYVVVSERVYVASLGRSAARAGTGIFAFFGAGRSGSLNPIAEVVAKRRNRRVGVTVVATRAGMRRVTGLSAGRLGYDCYVIVAKRVNRLSLESVAARAGTSLFAFFGASRIGRYDPCAEVVTERLDVRINVTVVATRAGMSGVALFRASRVGDSRYVVVAERVNRLSLESVTARAGTGLFA